MSGAITTLHTDSTDPCEGTLSDTEGRILTPNNKGEKKFPSYCSCVFVNQLQEMEGTLMSSSHTRCKL